MPQALVWGLVALSGSACGRARFHQLAYLKRVAAHCRWAAVSVPHVRRATCAHVCVYVWQALLARHLEEPAFTYPSTQNVHPLTTDGLRSASPERYALSVCVRACLFVRACARAFTCVRPCLRSFVYACVRLCGRCHERRGSCPVADRRVDKPAFIDSLT